MSVLNDIESQGSIGPQSEDYTAPVSEFDKGPDGVPFQIYRPWAEVIGEVRRTYPNWLRSIELAVGVIGGVSKWTDRQSSPPVARWTTRAVLDLLLLRGLYMPFQEGADGLGVVRVRRTVPPALWKAHKRVERRRLELIALMENPVAQMDAPRQIDPWLVGDTEARVASFLHWRIRRGVTSPPTSEEVGDSIERSAAAVRNSDAWKAATGAAKDGKVLDNVQRKSRSQYGRTKAQQVEQDDGVERSD